MTWIALPELMAVRAIYVPPIAAANLPFDDPQRNAQQARVVASIQYLGEHMRETSILVVPCIIPPGGAWRVNWSAGGKRRGNSAKRPVEFGS